MNLAWDTLSDLLSAHVLLKKNLQLFLRLEQQLMHGGRMDGGKVLF